MIKEILAQLDYRVLGPLHTVTFGWLLTTEVLIGLAIVFCLQFLIPARPTEKNFSSHVLADVVWFFYAYLMATLALTTYVVWVSTFLKPYLVPFQVTALNTWPVWLRFIIIFLFIELMFWLVHYATHKSRILWQFHAVHHSQTELSFFTDSRMHILEYFLRPTFTMIPLLLVGLELPVIVAFLIFETWYPRIYHSNLRINLGPLKYIFVTPQSHRFHHINDPKLRDMNFGRFLTVWDWVFGTQATEWSTYAATGIEDRSFPLEPDRPTVGLLWLPIVQQLYPFKKLAAMTWNRICGGKADVIEGSNILPQ